MQQLRFRRAAAILPVLFIFSLMSAKAQQAPIALPYTMTTIARDCSDGGNCGDAVPQLAYGCGVDRHHRGCGALAVNATFGVAGRGGVASGR